MGECIQPDLIFLMPRRIHIAGADLSRVDTSADDIRKDAMAAVNDYVEKLRGFVVRSCVGSEVEADLETKTKANTKSESGAVAVLSSLAELCREEGAAGEANRMAVGVVCVKFEHAPHVFVSLCV